LSPVNPTTIVPFAFTPTAGPASPTHLCFAPHQAAIVKVFGRRPSRAFPRALRPASENLHILGTNRPSALSSAHGAEQGPAVGRHRGIVSEVVSKIGSVRSRCVEGVGRPWIDFHGRPGPAYAPGRGSWRSWSTRSFTEPSVRPDFEGSATRNPQRNAGNLVTRAVAPCRQGFRRGTSPTRSSRKSG
jgi:hypothetical protein